MLGRLGTRLVDLLLRRYFPWPVRSKIVPGVPTFKFSDERTEDAETVPNWSVTPLMISLTDAQSLTLRYSTIAFCTVPEGFAIASCLVMKCT
jgi:hypothetical protein